MHTFIARNIASYGEDEITIAALHRHWFDIITSFFLVFLMLIFLLGGHILFPLFFPIAENPEYAALFSLFESSFSMLILVLFSLIWIDYYFDVWIITNKRIINIEQHGLFSREISELELDKIQDVSADIMGIIPTFLNYGDVYVQTAGETERFEFKKIPNPYDIKDLIMSLEKNNEARIEKEKAMTGAKEMKSAFQDQNFQ